MIYEKISHSTLPIVEWQFSNILTKKEKLVKTHLSETFTFTPPPAATREGPDKLPYKFSRN